MTKRFCEPQNVNKIYLSYYAVLWLVFMWSPYPWSPVEITPVLTVLWTCEISPCKNNSYDLHRVITHSLVLVILSSDSVFELKYPYFPITWILCKRSRFSWILYKRSRLFVTWLLGINGNITNPLWHHIVT